MVHVKLLQLFEEADDINNMDDMELSAFEAHLDTMLDQLSEESTELIIERPRYAHAVMVLASGDEPGELLTASRIKMLDPIYAPVEGTVNDHQIFHHYSESKNATAAVESTSDFNEKEGIDLISTPKTYDDDDIQKALNKLEESRNMLDEPFVSPLANKKVANDLKLDYTNANGAICSKTPTTKTASYKAVSPVLSRSICDTYTALKGNTIVFPSQLRQGRRISASTTHKLL